MNKTVHWQDFLRFMKDNDLWSRWQFEHSITEDEQYFLQHWNAVRENKLMANFDFSKTNLTVMSKDEGSINWEHDGESLWYFFQLWAQGKRV